MVVVGVGKVTNIRVVTIVPPMCEAIKDRFVTTDIGGERRVVKERS